MNKDILLSVIMPIYNGEKYLSRAIDSVLCQMDDNIELILVNDGSTDCSGQMCDEYAQVNSNVKVIHKENGGTSSAKNMGIRVSQGKYLSFMDCDDHMEKDTYRSILEVLSVYEPDCLDFGMKYIGKTGTSLIHHKIEKNVLHSKDIIEKTILPPLLNLCKDDEYFIYDYAVNKIYKADIIKENHIFFDESKRVWEDRTFLLRYLKHCKNYYSMEQYFYNYMYTPNSLSAQYTPEFFGIILQNYHHYRELYEDEYDFCTEYVNQHWASAIWNMILRSLEEAQDKHIILRKMREILCDEQVVEWFKERPIRNEMERKASKYVVQGEIEKLLIFAQQYLKKKKRQDKRERVINSLKYRLHKVVKGKKQKGK